jgi:hypothetical protein
VLSKVFPASQKNIAMYWLAHPALPAVGRLFAFAVGSFALYIAVFMYPDERSQWQNRLENVWIEIDERAKRTDTIFTALVNKVSAGTVKVFNAIFGKETFSLKLVVVSVNFSLLAELVFNWLAYWGRTVPRLLHTDYYLIALSSLCCTYFAIRSHRKLFHVVSFIPVAWYIEYLRYPLSLYSFFELFVARDQLAQELTLEMTLLAESKKMTALVELMAFTLSLLVDIVAVVLIKKIFAKLAVISSVARVLLRCLLLVAIGFSAVGVPFFLGSHLWRYYYYYYIHLYYLRSSNSNPAILSSSVVLEVLGLLDGITLIYCVAPAIALLGLVLHRAIWPLLARFTYPLLEFQIVRNRRFLIPIGTAALGVALGANSKALEFFKLFGK